MQSNILIKKVLLILIVLLTVFSIKMPSKSIITKKKSKNKNHEYARLIIPKIKINQELYSINSKNNNVDTNITILKESIPPTKKDSIMFIAAHSGTGEIAFFERLNELSINDEVRLTYKNKKYLYSVIETWEEKKNGYINVNKAKKKQLILTTCSPKNDGYQLIVNCTEKEPN